MLAYTEEGIKYPYRRKGDASVQVPGIGEKFKTYASYAQSDVNEIYGKENLERALHYQATTFGSVYIENMGDGNFEFRRLPVEAQFSSINDILVHDYNRDGYPDLLVAGNMFAVEVRTPRNDAGIGLLLLGDGKGDFQPVSYLESGFFVPFDVKSMNALTVGGSRYIIVGCNNDEMQVFKVK